MKSARSTGTPPNGDGDSEEEAKKYKKLAVMREKKIEKLLEEMLVGKNTAAVVDGAAAEQGPAADRDAPSRLSTNSNTNISALLNDSLNNAGRQSQQSDVQKKLEFAQM